MLTIVEIGAQQYMVQENDVLYVQKINYQPNSEVVFDKVLWYKNTVGTPYVANVEVVCKILSHGKQKKILVIKHKRYNRMLKRYGHRQPYTKLSVVSIRKR